MAVYYCDPDTEGCSWVVDSVKESDETNNVAVGDVIVIGTVPDLTVTALAAPGGGVSGSSISVSNTVAIVGTATAPASTVAVQISTDGSFGSGVTPLGTRSVPSLAAGTTSPP